jgi:hypothetical protein
MEALLFALLIVRDAHRRPETCVPEPHKFESLDLRALRQVCSAKDNSRSRQFDLEGSYAGQSVS